MEKPKKSAATIAEAEKKQQKRGAALKANLRRRKVAARKPSEAHTANHLLSGRGQGDGVSPQTVSLQLSPHPHNDPVDRLRFPRLGERNAHESGGTA